MQPYNSRSQPKPIRASETVEKAISLIESRFDFKPSSNEQPIFILAAGWRCGSTLLQRLVNSNGEALIWGEPFANCNIVQTQAESLRSFTHNYPQDAWLLANQNSEKPLHQQETANLYPDVANLIEGYRALLETTYKHPAIERNYHRWGFKEVRLTSVHGLYLKWLYPQAKILLLYRNPYQAFRSLYPHLGKWNLYFKWKDKEVTKAQDYGRCWYALVKGYIEDAEKLDALLMSYEQLTSDSKIMSKISSYLGISLKKDAIHNKIGSSQDKDTVPNKEIRKLETIVGSLASSLGYYPQYD